MNLSVPITQLALKIANGERISQQEGIVLLEQFPLALLGALATVRKKESSGDKVFYNRNIHIEPTNICLFRCKFCSYRRDENEQDAWYYSLDEVEQIALGYKSSPITEVHIVGGVHPSHDLDYYIEMVRRVKKALPHIVVKAYTAVELAYIIKKSGLPLRDGLARLKEAGMEAIPGGGAEIFAPEIRTRICPEKSTAEEWLETHRVAHELGIKTNATILYGHVENYRHRIDHLARLRDLQDATGGFDAFIPLKYRNRHNSMEALGEVNINEDMRMLAFGRIFLDNFPHIKAYWPMLGKQATGLALAFGADDIDGTIDDTTKIYSMAGADDTNPTMSVSEMRGLIEDAGYLPIERDTFYNEVK